MAASDSDRARLRIIHDGIDDRVEHVRESRPWWPCRAGCDHCCRHLGAVPTMTEGEWALLREGLLALTPQVRAEVRGGIEALGRAEAPVVCPMLDREAGACRVYEHRPSDCRTYGYFASRTRDLWCHHIDAAIDASRGEPPTWGNQAAVERRLIEAFGPRRSLPEWLEEDPELTPPPHPRRSS